MKRLVFVISLCLAFCMQSSAQVSFVEDGNVSSLISRFKSHHADQSTIKGWRIQVVTTNDRRTMESAIAKLQKIYPNLEYDWKHVSPYYQVKVGAYEEKQELQQFLINMKKDFPSAIPVMDDILKEDLL